MRLSVTIFIQIWVDGYGTVALPVNSHKKNFRPPPSKATVHSGLIWGVIGVVVGKTALHCKIMQFWNHCDMGSNLAFIRTTWSTWLPLGPLKLLKSPEFLMKICQLHYLKIFVLILEHLYPIINLDFHR